MPRKSKGPRFYASKNAYFANLDGDRVPLCPGPKNKANDELARELYDNEVAARRAHKAGDRAPCWTIFNAWITWCKNRTEPPPVAPNSLKHNLLFINSFIEMHGNVVWRDLLPSHFDEWLAAHKKPAGARSKKGWIPSTIKAAMTVMRSATSWASTVGGLVKHNPLNLPGSEKLRKKGVRYKGRRLAITEQEHRAMLEYGLRKPHRDWAPLLMLWWDTGARPAELALAKASEWNEAKQTITIAGVPENQGRFKLAYLGAPRVVYIPDYLVPLVASLCRRRPTGLLFRNTLGNAFGADCIVRLFLSTRKIINKRAGKEVIREGVTAYSYRHAFVTRWLLAGRDPMRLCELLGTSMQMLHRHYSHLFEEDVALRDALNQFVAGQKASPSTDDEDDEEADC
jgi:integrase